MMKTLKMERYLMNRKVQLVGANAEVEEVKGLQGDNNSRINDSEEAVLLQCQYILQISRFYNNNQFSIVIHTDRTHS